jgi:hypothetical protein
VESPKAPLPMIKIDEGILRDAEDAIVREVKAFRDTTTRQKERKT